MANAIREIQTIVHLELTDDEAYTLRQVLASVGGGTYGGHRDRARGIAAALESQGYGYLDVSNDDFPFDSRNRALLFKDSVEPHPWDTPEERERDMEASWDTPR
jgi:hypothetical protein